MCNSDRLSFIEGCGAFAIVNVSMDVWFSSILILISNSKIFYELICKRKQIPSLLLPVNQIEKVFNAASHKNQKVWDQFTKPQRKNISSWCKQAMVCKRWHKILFLFEQLQERRRAIPMSIVVKFKFYLVVEARPDACFLFITFNWLFTQV